MAKRPRGTGCLYQQPGSKIWWVQFHLNGQRFRESTGTDKKRKAQDYLRDKIAEASLGTYSPKALRVTVTELVEAKLSHDRANALKSSDDNDTRWKSHLQPAFGHLRAASLSTPLLSRYVEQRREEKAYPATINRELALLRAAFHLAHRSSLVRVIPFFPMLKENNARKGFLKDEQYTRLADECGKVGLWLRALFEVAYTFGWRRGELVSLKCKQVDLAAKTIRLYDSKNHCGRVVVMTEKVHALLSAVVNGKSEDEFIFTWADGRPVKDFRRTWEKVTDAAGCAGLLLHDLRRTACRNARRVGVSESIAMQMSGHKTASVFKRYDITDEIDLADAAKLLDAKAKTLDNNLSHSLAIVAEEFSQIVSKAAN